MDVIITDSLADDQIVAYEEASQWGIEDWQAVRERLLAPRPEWSRNGNDHSRNSGLAGTHLWKAQHLALLPPIHR